MDSIHQQTQNKTRMTTLSLACYNQTNPAVATRLLKPVLPHFLNVMTSLISATRTPFAAYAVSDSRRTVDSELTCKGRTASPVQPIALPTASAAAPQPTRGKPTRVSVSCALCAVASFACVSCWRRTLWRTPVSVRTRAVIRAARRDSGNRRRAITTNGHIQMPDHTSAVNAVSASSCSRYCAITSPQCTVRAAVRRSRLTVARNVASCSNWPVPFRRTFGSPTEPTGRTPVPTVRSVSKAASR